jgi:hypothetical protein
MRRPPNLVLHPSDLGVSREPSIHGPHPTTSSFSLQAHALLLLLLCSASPAETFVMSRHPLAVLPRPVSSACMRRAPSAPPAGAARAELHWPLHAGTTQAELWLPSADAQARAPAGPRPPAPCEPPPSTHQCARSELRPPLLQTLMLLSSSCHGEEERRGKEERRHDK